MPGVTMMHHATKRGFKDCRKCAPLAHPLKGHRWGTGPKRCPARARRANVPPEACEARRGIECQCVAGLRTAVWEVCALWGVIMHSRVTLVGILHSLAIAIHNTP